MEEIKIKLIEHPKIHNFNDITGFTYGRLQVIGYAGDTKWYCKCTCGNIKAILSGNLKSGHTVSCGCYLLERIKESRTLHSMSYSTEYKAYSKAKIRCNNNKYTCYKNYGGRGVKFLFNSFGEFYNHIGPKLDPSLSLDRIDVNGNYEIGNVRWATTKQQSNNKTTTIYVEDSGTKKSLKEWCDETGLNYANTRRKIKNEIKL